MWSTYLHVKIAGGGGGEGKRADGGKGGLQEVGNENELDAICLIQNMRQFAFVSMKKRVN